MKSLCVILSVLGLWLRLTQAASLSQITWTNSLKNEVEVLIYKGSSHGMASEMLSLDTTAPGKPVVKMGPSAAGAFTLDACLKMLKFVQLSKALFLEVTSMDLYKAAKTVLMDESNSNAKAWVTLHMRVFRGPDAMAPAITPSMIQAYMTDGIMKSFGMTALDGDITGFTEEMIGAVAVGWAEAGFNMVNDLCFVIDIHNIAYSDPRVLPMIDSFLKNVAKRVYYLKLGSLDFTHLENFKRYFQDKLDSAYLNVPDLFRNELFGDRPTIGPDNKPEPEVTTEVSGGRALVPMGMIIGVLAIAGNQFT